MRRRSPLTYHHWLTVLLLVFAMTGCSRGPETPKYSPAAREAQTKLSIKYAKHYIEVKDFDEAARYVESIEPDAPYAKDIAELRGEIDKLVAEYDESVKARYAKEETIPVNMELEVTTGKGEEFVVHGKTLLPPHTRVTASLWREETPGNWQKLSEEMSEIGGGSRFQAVLSAYKQTPFDRAGWVDFFNKNFEIRLSAYFRSNKDQPESVLRLVGTGGKKLTGNVIEKQDDANFLTYRQKYHMKTEGAEDANSSTGHCIYVKPTKI